MRQLWDCLIFVTRIPVLISWHVLKWYIFRYLLQAFGAAHEGSAQEGQTQVRWHQQKQRCFQIFLLAWFSKRNRNLKEIFFPKPFCATESFICLRPSWVVLKKRHLCINPLWPSDATWICVNIGSSNGLVPDGTKPLPEPMLTYHQQGPVAFIWVQFYKRCLSHQSLKLAWKLLIQIFVQISQGPMS